MLFRCRDNRAEQLARVPTQSESESAPGGGRKHGKAGGGAGNFFKRRTARRAKSLGKDHWDDVIFGELNTLESTR